MRTYKSNKETFFKFFYPPADWDKQMSTKEQSLYYEILCKDKGKDFADKCWTKRLELERGSKRVDSYYQIYEAVKNYKPRDIINDFSWGYNVIRDANN